MTTWLSPLDRLKGVGPKTLEAFHQIGLYTIKDLLFHLPFRFEDIQARSLDTVQDQENVVLMGKVVSPPTISYFGHKRSRLAFKLAVDSQNIIQVVFFNQPYLKSQLELGQEKAIYGKWQSNRQELLAMKFIPLGNDQDLAPVYPSTQGLKQSQIQKAMLQAFENYGDSIVEEIPAFINQALGLMSIRDALMSLHFPKEGQDQQKAKEKLTFYEFFFYQLRLQMARYQMDSQSGLVIAYAIQDLKRAIEAIPFELTQGQKQAVNEICRDLLSPSPMRRLLQGDVGSGKTLVAFIAMIATAYAGYQAALMVPTEILARQHLISFNRYFEEMGLHAELLTSEMAREEKHAVQEGLKKGRIRIVIGTHALIQDSVAFQKLGLVVIDEQHRFGVGQRQALLDKGEGGDLVNCLQMTATPIPRSLAQTLYADLQVSTISELPKGRMPITTYWVKEEAIESVYQRMASEIDQGRQVYYVLPLIDKSEHFEQVENVMEVAERLHQKFPQYQIGVLHGQLAKKDQEAVMSAFKANQVQILVATTMVEVGVDVPNATVMVIQSAERFGLAQLHQLRGRVGRGQWPSYCYLLGQVTTDQGRQRLEAMVASQDGFELSQMDMEIRGSGDLLGRSQSGLPSFRYGNIFDDQEWMALAYQAVQQIMSQPQVLSNEEGLLLKEVIADQVMEI